MEEMREGDIYVQEETGEEQRELVEWFLITNEEVVNVEGAYEKIRWYMRRREVEDRTVSPCVEIRL